MFICKSAEKTFSILRYNGCDGHRYSVSESGLRLVWIFPTLEEAYQCLIKRAHQAYQRHVLALAEQKETGKALSQQSSLVSNYFDQIKGSKPNLIN